MKQPLLIALTASVLAALPSSLAAQTENTLTGASIRDFYEEQANKHLSNYANYVLFVEQTTHIDFEGYETTTTRLTGYEPQEQTKTLDKQALIEKKSKEYETLKEATVKTEILGLEILPGGQSALVEFKTIIQDIKTLIPGISLYEPMTMHATKECMNMLSLRDDGVIQVIGSDCQTQMTQNSE